MPDTKKILGWGKCTIDGKNDIIEGSASLSVEEGEEQEALIEGGSAEGRKKAPGWHHCHLYVEDQRCYRR